jgi:DNA gyrase subunit A
VGALIVDVEDELYAITSSGGVIRTMAAQVRKAGRQTKGVRLMNLDEGTTLLAVARNADEPSDVPSDVASAGIEGDDTTAPEN